MHEPRADRVRARRLPRTQRQHLGGHDRVAHVVGHDRVREDDPGDLAVGQHERTAAVPAPDRRPASRTRAGAPRPRRRCRARPVRSPGAPPPDSASSGPPPGNPRTAPPAPRSTSPREQRERVGAVRSGGVQHGEVQVGIEHHDRRRGVAFVAVDPLFVRPGHDVRVRDDVPGGHHEAAALVQEALVAAVAQHLDGAVRRGAGGRARVGVGRRFDGVGGLRAAARRTRRGSPGGPGRAAVRPASTVAGAATASRSWTIRELPDATREPRERAVRQVQGEEPGHEQQAPSPRRPSPRPRRRV